VLSPRGRNMPSPGRDRRQSRRMHRRQTHATRPGRIGRPLSDGEPHWVLPDAGPSRIRLRLPPFTRSSARPGAELRLEDRRDMGDVTAVKTRQSGSQLGSEFFGSTSCVSASASAQPMGFGASTSNVPLPATDAPPAAHRPARRRSTCDVAEPGSEDHPPCSGPAEDRALDLVVCAQRDRPVGRRHPHDAQGALTVGPCLALAGRSEDCYSSASATALKIFLPCSFAIHRVIASPRLTVSSVNVPSARMMMVVFMHLPRT